MIKQKEIIVPAKGRGFHLITRFIEENLSPLPESGILHLFILHTSAALTINENADISVRDDLETFINSHVPDSHTLYTHNTEGDDDMPAHIKTSLIGQSLTIPISKGRLKLGTWQGIYLCEFRNHAGNRHIFATIIS